MERESLQANFRQEFLKARLEIQEQTFAHVSREIHDNITQVLSFVKLNLAMMGGTNAEQQAKISENRDLIAQVITDLRDLSKSLSFENITKQGLVKTIEIETRRINKSGLLNSTLLIEGDSYPLGEQRELVLFRIFQEALNNTLKHSGAKDLTIALQYIPEMFTLTLEDNGTGFLRDNLDDFMGAGLKNIENRASLIGAVATINSEPGNGCSIKISLNPLEQRLYADGNHQDHIG
ncbi:sensor histidine kinase [Mucilaginibacter frigoritolerans]|uniref:sensor histidine kinase n=1 Tax=Mucilaginibacter frigoritolerans TaxID=652788 RepID=UPI001476AE82|nr:ATP-binding protein [Mucilaginibacter frigoritolerans]